MQRIFNKAYFSSASAILLALPAILLSGCVILKPATLYDGYVVTAPAPVPDRISKVVEPVIFKDDTRDVWGIEKDVCKNVTKSLIIAHSGHTALRLEWDRNAPGCTWAGIGIGWDGYAPKDLSAIMNHAAISFYVRTVQGRSFGLPFVLTFEDYSGGMGFCYTANKYFERTTLDEEWQRVLVPLADFDLKTERLDVTNIKQLQIELQQSGAVYIDQIELVFYKPEPQAPWVEVPDPGNPLKFPIVIFGDEFINNHGWGMISDPCQSFSISGSQGYEGRKSIHAKWNASADCHLVRFGASWHKWYPVDLRPALQAGHLQFMIKPVIMDGNAEIKVGFEDYDRNLTWLPVQSYLKSGVDAERSWQKASIPLAELPKSADFSRIKHLYFELNGTGECFIDEITLVYKND